MSQLHQGITLTYHYSVQGQMLHNGINRMISENGEFKNI